MKRIILPFILFLISVGLQAQSNNPKPFVIPELANWTGLSGDFVPSGNIIVKDKSFTEVAQTFAKDYEDMFGKKLQITKGKAKAGDFVFTKAKQGTEESYELKIEDATTINAATPTGAFWATRTILQISEQNETQTLPKGTTNDAPQYGIRGLVIDCGRKFISINYLQRLVKAMSYYKMNALQVHLNDNGFPQYFNNDWNLTQAAFRMECETYPGLTAKDGSYSKKEFIALQKLGQQYGVEVIPEIDVPAHSLAFTHYKPEIGSKDYGMDHLDLFNPETYTFLDKLFEEYLGGKEPVFISKHFNIGTDEYSNRDKTVVEKFRYFTDRYLKLAQSYGKEVMCWGSLTHAKGETPITNKDVIMNCWSNGYADPKEMKELGYKLLSIPDGYVYIVPAAGYYYDYLNCEYLYNSWTPADIGGVRFEENDPSIVGGMFAVWNDHVGNGITTDDIHDRVFPALQTISVKCWTGKNTTLSYADFLEQSKLISEAPCVNELGRTKNKITIHELQPNSDITACKNLRKIGFNHTISFDIDCQKEERGTILTQSEDNIFYLSNPQDGRIGFSCDGYMNAFNYRLPESGKVHVMIKTNNKDTRLFVNGKEVSALLPTKVYAIYPENMLRKQAEGTYAPIVFVPTGRNTMSYQSTLHFPLEKTGNFKSRIENIEIKNTK